MKERDKYGILYEYRKALENKSFALAHRIYDANPEVQEDMKLIQREVQCDNQGYSR